MESSRDDHSRHLEHRQLAAALEEREEALHQLQEQMQGAEERRTASDAACAEARAAYDADEHRGLQQEHAHLTEEGARLDERLKANRRQLVALQQDIETLRAVERDLARTQSRLEQLLRLSEALEFLRKTVRAAGPYVTRALVRDISLEADRIFGEILNDRTMRLQWGEDYGITVEHLGNERDFSQLSGGEKAAAALAVRLALLRAMTAIRVAFFDEPTAHLDDQRRDNLAAQITEIRGFQQLFVISHDDAFERQTHHVLRVHKENSVSQVEVA
jgi:exonuclease SbcC